jgi:hypothetical protein
MPLNKSGQRPRTASRRDGGHLKGRGEPVVCNRLYRIEIPYAKKGRKGLSGWDEFFAFYLTRLPLYSRSNTQKEEG